MTAPVAAGAERSPVPWDGPEPYAPVGVPLVDLLDRVLATGVVDQRRPGAGRRRRAVGADLPARPAGVGRRPGSGALAGQRAAVTAPRDHTLDLDPERVANDLAALVLTVVELLRQLMERQAVRRFDEGTLSAEQEDRLGTALMLLDERMDELCERHGLRRSDLNLDLGPLGPLLADPGP